MLLPLPMDSATKTAMRDDMSPEDWARERERETDPLRHGPWSRAEMLLAAALDELRAQTWQRTNEGVETAKQTKQPDPYPRPGVGVASVTPINSRSREYLDRLRANGGAVDGG